jgi:hypothetical protein
MTGDNDIHFVEDLEERENASMPIATTLAVGEEGGGGIFITQACFETGCGGWPTLPLF